MAKITLLSIDWTLVPDSPKMVVISYRRTTDPDVPASYIIVASGVWVPPSGEFYAPVEIGGLDPAQEYTVKVVSVCGNYSFQQNFVFNDDTADFSFGFSLGFTA